MGFTKSHFGQINLVSSVMSFTLLPTLLCPSKSDLFDIKMKVFLRFWRNWKEWHRLLNQIISKIWKFHSKEKKNPFDISLQVTLIYSSQNAKNMSVLCIFFSIQRRKFFFLDKNKSITKNFKNDFAEKSSESQSTCIDWCTVGPVGICCLFIAFWWVSQL